MSDSDDETRPVILLSREDDGWRAKLPEILQDWQSDLTDIQSAVTAAREAAGQAAVNDLRIKVAERTILSAQDILTLIEANDRPEGLDLSKCGTLKIDLSRETIEHKAELYVRRHSIPPPWFSLIDDGVDLTGVRFREASLNRAQLQGADLSSADLTLADLSGANLEGADLLDAELEESRLWEARFQGATLRSANLAKADFRLAHLQSVDLSDAKSLVGARWYGAFLDRTRLRQEQLGATIGDEKEVWSSDGYRRAKEAYLALKNNFNTIGRYEDAAWAYVKEQRMEKAALVRQLDWQQFPRRPFWRAFTPWALNWAWDALTGYGETPQKPLGVAAVLASLFFPLLYWAIGALPGHGAAFTSASPSDIDWAGLSDSLIFSLTSFATLSFSRLQPEGTLPNLIAASEAMIGVLLFALFVFTLGNRMSRS